MSYKVLHIIQQLSLGGAARAMMSVARYGSASNGFSHSVASIIPADPAAVSLAEQHGMRVINCIPWESLVSEIADADIVLLQWWNSPEMSVILRQHLPPCRLAAWMHVGGHQAPQEIPADFVNFLDLAIACSPYTYECPAISALSEGERSKKSAMVYGAADFARLQGFHPRSHDGFNVGYIGTVHPLKMHPSYIRMSARIIVPGTKFIVCGTGEPNALKEEASRINAAERFDFRGYVDDVKPVIEEFDVYGYPLCEDTYAASEMNLQEVMYCGIPPIVFPYGGIKRLVIHNQTGLVVHTEEEYVAAIEHLYHHPAERRRLGEGAREYARNVFGAENAAIAMNALFSKLLAEPKREHVWQSSFQCSDEMRPLLTQGAQFFLESVPGARSVFIDSMMSGSDENLLSSDERIKKLSPLMKSSGVMQYRRVFAQDPWLSFWAGLIRISDKGTISEGISDLLSALENGLSHWRIFLHLALAFETNGDKESALRCCEKIAEAGIKNGAVDQLVAQLSNK